jgi:hypothetical protein
VNGKIARDSESNADRPVVLNETPTDRPSLDRPETPVHRHATGTDGLPAAIREAAAKDAPGRITSVDHYVTSDIDVYVVRVNAADGVRELRIRQDGVVLLNTLNPVETQAGFENEMTMRGARESRERPE